MAGGYLKRLLGEREEVILVARQHWFVLLAMILPELLLIGAFLILVTVLWTAAATPMLALGYLVLVFPLISMARDVLIWANHQYVVTSRRVIQLFGVLHKNVTDSSLEKVNDVMMEQSFLGRLFGFGDIQILTASEMGINRFTQIGNPIRFKTAMLNAKERLERETPAAVGEAPIPDLIAQLENLRKQGVLTEEEFAAKKDALLKKI